MSITFSGRFLRRAVAAAGCAAVVLAPAAAQAQAYTGATPPQVGPVDAGGRVLGSGGSSASGGTAGPGGSGVTATGRGTATDFQTSNASSPTSSRSGLPVTGSDVLQLTIVGFGAVGVGTLLVQKSRRRQAA